MSVLRTLNWLQVRMRIKNKQILLKVLNLNAKFLSFYCERTLYVSLFVFLLLDNHSGLFSILAALVCLAQVLFHTGATLAIVSLQIQYTSYSYLYDTIWRYLPIL